MKRCFPPKSVIYDDDDDDDDDDDGVEYDHEVERV